MTGSAIKPVLGSPYYKAFISRVAEDISKSMGRKKARFSKIKLYNLIWNSNEGYNYLDEFNCHQFNHFFEEALWHLVSNDYIKISNNKFYKVKNFVSSFKVNK